jgi:ketosteroid isomerase-like protein
MNIIRSWLAIIVPIVVACTSTATAGPSHARESLQKTGQAIRDAFARGDVAAIMAYHHPDVMKALSYDKYLAGRDAVEADLRGNLQKFNLEFTESRVENLLIRGDTAVEQSAFTIRGTPRKGGEPFLFRGRALVVYVRYDKSPTGWASIRELIQPAPVP